MLKYIIASRPWSFTAAIIPILLTTAVLQQSFLSLSFIRILLMGIFVQAGANLSNTYFDYISGVDKKNEQCGDRTLVDKIISPSNLLLLSILCYMIGIGSVATLLIAADSTQTLHLIFSAGILLAFFYTAQPLALKYIALGDVVIFFCFGPLLMQATSLILIQRTDVSLYYYSISVGLLTEAILHANNSRDIKADKLSGILTLANLVGLRMSFIIYISLLMGAYLSSVYISARYHSGCLLSFITLPMAIDAIKKFNSNNLINLDQETAKMHLPFGLLMVVGVLITPSGFL